MTMTVSRRRFVADASLFGIFTALLPELAAAQDRAPQVLADDTPHDSYDFWNGFFDSVNPLSPNYGNKAASRGPADQLPDPAAETQYLHYCDPRKSLRYASDIAKDELLDHDGDVSVSIALSQYRPATSNGEPNTRAAQLRVDTTQIHPYMNIIAPLAWTAIASLEPSKAGKVSLDQLGFRNPQAQLGTSKILLTQGTGKLAVNISKAGSGSIFVKALNIMLQGAKIAAPLVTLPAISVPALSAFTEALSYWEDRTRFIGLLSGDYLMVPQKHTDELAKELPNLDLVQGYLVHKDADPSLPLQTRAENVVPGVSYASMHVSVAPLDASSSAKPEGGSKGSGSGDSSGSGSSGGSKKSGGSGKGSSSGKTKS
jgi:uncharacterized membrane protein YgcG